jgi:NADPH:quinone reductase-like Zn-dependent oxidoreductase
MRALIIRGHGELSMLEHADHPKPQIAKDSEVSIAIRAAALNHLDLHTLRGLPGLALDFPHILGGDGAGVVDAVGSAVTSVQPGDRVMFNPGISCYACEQCLGGEQSLCVRYRLLGEHLPGTLAEYVVVPGANVVVIPELPPSQPEISWGEAAAFSLATLTAWRMVMTRARLMPGETVLIWGIGGGVATAALGIAKLAGARAIVTSSSDRKLAAARELGADVTLNHEVVDVSHEVRKLTNKRGVDVVVENPGEATWEQSLRSLSKMGRLVTCGGTTGPMVTTDVRRLFWNQYTIMGSTMGNATEYRRIVGLLAQGRLRPHIDQEFPFENATDAFRRLERGEQLGKIVVRV